MKGKASWVKVMENVTLLEDFFFMDLVCLGVLVVDLGRVFRAVAPLPRNSIRYLCLDVAHRAGISGIALLESNSIGCRG